MGRKGQIPWNKGLTKETDVRVKKYSETNSNLKIRKPSKKIKYSINPEDWKIKCGKCNNVMIYTNRESYSNALRRNISSPENPITCEVCRNYHKNDDKKYKYKDKTDEEKKEIISKQTKDRWANYTPEERGQLNNKIRDSILKRDPELRKEQYKKVSESNKKRMTDLNYENQFKPGYNKESIDFIITVLNNRFDTEFRHAETINGEYRIYDKENKCFYFADAYCDKLNLWIEIDEHTKFKNNKLKLDHVSKHYRIKELINCNIIRFKFVKCYKTKQIKSITEFYNDLDSFGLDLTREIIT